MRFVFHRALIIALVLVKIKQRMNADQKSAFTRGEN